MHAIVWLSTPHVKGKSKTPVQRLHRQAEKTFLRQSSLVLSRSEKIALQAKCAALALSKTASECLEVWGETGEYWLGAKNLEASTEPELVGLALIRAEARLFKSRTVLQTAEEWLSWHSWSCPLPDVSHPPLIFFDVVDAVHLEAPVSAALYATNSQNYISRSFWLLAEGEVNKHLLPRTVQHFNAQGAVHATSSVKEIVQEWSRQFSLLPGQPECLDLCFSDLGPIVLLTSCRSWPSLGQLPQCTSEDLRQKRRNCKSVPFQGLFGQPDLVIPTGKQPVRYGVERVATVETALSEKAALARLCGRMLSIITTSGAASSEQVAEIQFEVEACLVNLDQLHKTAYADAPGSAFPKSREAEKRLLGGDGSADPTLQDMPTGGRRKESSRVLLHAVSTCLLMRNSEDLVKQVASSLRLAVPDLAETVLPALQSLPHVSSVSRGRLAVDVGMMLAMSDLNARLRGSNTFVTRVLLADSSPQRGWDWLLSEYHTLHGGEGMKLISLAWQVATLQEEERACPRQDVSACSHEQSQLERQISQILQGSGTFASSLRPVDSHICPPTAVGSRRASLIHKIHALLHALLLENSLFSGLQVFLLQVRAVTTDFGVESGFADAADVPLHELFPYMLDVDFWSPDEAADNVELSAGQQVLPYLFQEALQIPGCLHILHGATKDLTNAFKQFDPFFFPRLKAVAATLSRSDVKDRFLHHCILGTPGALFSDSIRQFSCTVVTWRWGYIIQTCQELVELEAPLSYWDLGKINQGGAEPRQRRDADGDEDAAERQQKLELATQAISSGKFWSYCKMLCAVSAVLDHLEHWLESCPCHWKTAQRKNLYFRSHTTCFMSGRRAPELASGKIHSLMSAHFQNAHLHVLSACMHVPPDEQAEILEDFTIGQTRVTQFLNIKLGFWESLPHRLAVIGHFSEDAARSGLAACLEAYRAQGPDVLQHRLVRKYFDADTADAAWLEQLQRFLSGERREGLHLIMQEACKMGFIAVNERSIESRHATAATKVKLVKNIRPSGFSLGLRASELHQRFLRDNRSVDFLLHKVIHAREEGFLEATGLAGHPTALSIARDHNRKLKLAEIARIIYHCDLETTMRARTYSSTPAGPPQDGPGRRLRLAVQQAPDEPSRQQACLHHLMSQHFQTRMQEGDLFCCKADATAKVVPLSQRTSSKAVRRTDTSKASAERVGSFAACFSQPSHEVTSAFDDVESASAISVFSERLAPTELEVSSTCFRVVKSHPARQKQLHGTSGKNFESFDVLVSTHELQSGGGAQPGCDPVVSLRPGSLGLYQDTVGVWQMPQVTSFEDAENLLLSWKVKHAGFSLSTPLLNLIWSDDIRADAVAILSKILQLCAFECTQTCHYLDHDAAGANWDLKVLKLLKSLKIVTDLVHREDTSGWCVRTEWLRSLEITAPCAELQPVFAHPIDCETCVPSIEWTPFELGSYLCSHGWSLMVPMGKLSEVQRMYGAEYVLNDIHCPKFFFAWRGSINVKYWTCLALSVAMPDMLQFPGKDAPAITHCTNDEYYDVLLGLAKVKKRRGKAARSAFASIDFQAKAALADSVFDLLEGSEVERPEKAPPKKRAKKAEAVPKKSTAAALTANVAVEEAEELEDVEEQDDMAATEDEVECRSWDSKSESGKGRALEELLEQFEPSEEEVDLDALLNQAVDEYDFAEQLQPEPPELQGLPAVLEVEPVEPAAPAGAGAGIDSDATETDPDSAKSEAEVNRAVRAPVVREESFTWHGYRFTYRPPAAEGRPCSYQVVCPCHESDTGAAGTRCTRTQSWRNAADRDAVVRRLKHWLLEAGNHENKASHQQWDRAGLTPLLTDRQLERKFRDLQRADG